MYVIFENCYSLFEKVLVIIFEVFVKLVSLIVIVISSCSHRCIQPGKNQIAPANSQIKAAANTKLKIRTVPIHKV